MKSITRNLTLLTLAIGLIFHQPVEAQFAVRNSTFGNGSSVVSDSSFRIASTVGQPGVGETSGASFVASTGFAPIQERFAAKIGVPTPLGANVAVQPVDSTTGTSPAAVTFSTITEEGTTSLRTVTAGPPPPEGFGILGFPPTYYDLTTTATFSGSVGVCINYTGVSFTGKESSLKLYHFENDVWVNRTASLDTVNDIICADVTSLSPFVIVEPLTTDVTAMSQLTQFGTRFDRRTGQLSVMATWTNIGAGALSQPLQMVVESVTPSSVTIANADGTTADGKPFYDFSNFAGDGQLDAGETSAAKQLIFNNPTRVRFTFDVRFLAVAEGNNVGAAPPLRTLIEPPQTVDVERPLVSALEQNYPNPFNPETWIPYELADASRVTITIYDAQGWLVRRLDIGHRDVGRYLTKERAAYWDGRNDLGERVVSGVYFYQIRAGDFQSTRKMIVLK